MSEKTMRRRVVSALRPYDAHAVENSAYPGTPDVECTLGWLELKWLRSWPRVPKEAAVRIAHFTPQQRVWLRRRWLAGGSAWLLLKVGQDWLLYNGEIAAEFVGRCSREKLMDLCTRRWSRGLNKKELARCMAEAMESSGGSATGRPSSSTGGDVVSIKPMLQRLTASGEPSTRAGS